MAQVQKRFRKRDAILECLRCSKAHPSAEMLFNQLKPQIPDLSMGTVYRNLTLFKEQGLCSSVATVSGVERFDGNTAPHVHFICTDCTAVTDLPAIKVPEELNREVINQTGGQVDQCQLTFTGQCHQCLNKKGEVV